MCIQELASAIHENLHTQTVHPLAEVPEDFHKLPTNDALLKERAWRKDPKYFQKVHISALALMKMAIHAKSGGNIEIMGMLTGKVIHGAFVVMDVYALPVEGTETRVNAQAEGYEYMVQYHELLKQNGHSEHIVGWYHSHPGYGCWLSGIDVATQKLNQDFQDPYLAIVVDPIQTQNKGMVEIGAFRTYSDDYKPPAPETTTVKVRKLKQKDYGAHADRYYSLGVEIFTSPQDAQMLRKLRHESWLNNLIETTSYSAQATRDIVARIDTVLERLRTPDANDSMRMYDTRYLQKFRGEFESVLATKLTQPGVSSHKVVLATTYSPKRSDESDSDTDNVRALDISDADDAGSIDSTKSPHKHDDMDVDDGERRDRKRILSYDTHAVVDLNLEVLEAIKKKYLKKMTLRKGEAVAVSQSKPKKGNRTLEMADRDARAAAAHLLARHEVVRVKRAVFM